MPILQAFVTHLEDAGQRQRLCAAYTDCMAAKLGSAPERVRIALVPLQSDCVSVGGDTAQPLCLVNAYLMTGRTSAQKAALIEGLAEATRTVLDFPPGSVRILIHDVPADAVGIDAIAASVFYS